MTFLGEPAPRWFTIASQRPFLADLAAGLAGVLAPLGPQGAADALILLPTRRACRELAGAFVEASPGAAALLPRIRALGDLDESEAPFEPGEAALDLSPAISPSGRRFELARLVVENEALLERRLDAGAALELADALAAFLDACQIEEVGDPDLIDGLVEGELARHWRISADFLRLALVAWPRRLADLGLMDLGARRVALLRHLGAAWTKTPPIAPVIAAGSTGAAPAAADLLAVVAALPRGAVVLPGLDLSLAEEAWREVGEQHPQGGLKRLLARAGIDRSEVREWGSGEAVSAGRWRRRLISEALRPAEQTADWREVIEKIREEGGPGRDSIAQGLDGLFVTAAADEEEAAALAAVLMREALETPGATCALVTPDAALARRVSGRLERWNITADTSAGAPLAGFPAAVLASRIAAFTADPVSLLAILKHPLTRLARPAADLGRARRALERHGLRGPRPAGWEALTARLREKLADATSGEHSSPSRAAAIEAAMALIAPLSAALDLAGAAWSEETAPAAEAARALAAAMEALARGPGGGLGDLWGGQGGEALGALIASLIGESEGLPAVTRAGFSGLIDALLARELVRGGAATHPRLKILGVLESRLLAADALILAGLEEGVWPRGAPIDPFLSRPMRVELGLPPPERRLGLSAHDFAQGAASPQVVLIHSRRRAAAPAVESRWLWRLRVLASGAGLALPSRDDALAWARGLDAPVEAPPPALSSARRPRPAPPLAARPRAMAVTSIERWQRDPYSIYARDILRLRPLAPPDQQVDALARGTAIHKAIELFSKEHPRMGDDAEAVFERLLIEALAAAGVREERMARERALAANVAPWMVRFERRRRPGARILIENRGALTLPAPGGPFRLTARADRLEHRGETADILDFKTGAPPSDKQVRSGIAPQLTLTAAILAAGGFEGAAAVAPGELVYVRVRGGRIPAEEIAPAPRHESAGLAAKALAGLGRLVALFDDEATPYPSWVRPQFMSRYSGDYDHLARLWEWHVVGDPEGEGP
jgi:ATP-dependent helicase/nuclease subunit B